MCYYGANSNMNPPLTLYRECRRSCSKTKGTTGLAGRKAIHWDNARNKLDYSLAVGYDYVLCKSQLVRTTKTYTK